MKKNSIVDSVHVNTRISDHYHLSRDESMREHRVCVWHLGEFIPSKILGWQTDQWSVVLVLNITESAFSRWGIS